ncbi:pyridoxamine 5'-phosphate oxidase family protein [Ferruginibacter paludis]|uniref:pyridoxamine 5'-phosphate oxidase family protein n=1 Tax=Ferruginibacter paludis TaxID=1310417 RepID=UPI0025B4037C|nr:pyridoxamine 5'-phosphate oxidase family protein [Ferruginibacter paludis]MDN3655258.1 pyridoxamine 5'-phosphate oxidase family protein [Ferruginibacter paludis]
MIGILSAGEVELLLKIQVVGHLGCTDGYNTYVYPVNYVYDDHFIFCHSTPGAKLDMMRKNNRVCLQVEECIDFTHWKSVMVQGIFQELEEERDRYTAMKMFAEKNLYQKINQPVLPHNTTVNGTQVKWHVKNRPVFFRIVIDEKTGRYEDD